MNAPIRELTYAQAIQEALATGIRMPAVYEIAADIEAALGRDDAAALYRDLAAKPTLAPAP